MLFGRGDSMGAVRGRAVEALEQRLLFAAAPAPFAGQPQGVPGTVEFEKYDAGGEGVAYHVASPATTGGAFRADGVDIGAASDAGGGYFVGWANPGQWFNYTVNVASTTQYAIDFRVACGDNGGTFHVALDGADATGPIHLANTGGWQTWTTLTVPNVTIPAGQHSLRLVIDSAAAAGAGIGNFNWMRLRDNPVTSPRTQWWRDAHFGMFIHWGLYSQLAGHWNGQTTPGYGEWIMNDLHIPLAQYAQVASSFNPTQFNAAQWVQIAKSAGMQYIVITSKHHDGFSMFPTSVNAYNISSTPFGRDPLAELSAATRAAGLHFGLYYSILNWADPNASAAGIGTYVQTMETQLTELVTRYHPGILWFDGEWPTWWTDENGRELEEFVRNLDPSIIINNRVGKRLSTDGDFDTPEQSIPAGSSPNRLWETAMTLNDTWGYKDTDNNWKSPATVVSNLADIVSKGGNFLLNVGPTGQGIIPAPSVQILQQVGQWVTANGEAIYGAGPAPVAAPSWGKITEKQNEEYAIVFNWPTNGVLRVPVAGTAFGAELLTSGVGLPFTVGSGGIDVSVPAAMPMQPATVIRIDLGRPATGGIAGQAFVDANHNGARDTGEAGLAGATVFLDANHNGVLDPGETAATTDANGNYAFSGLAPGAYVVSEVAPAGMRRTTTYAVNVNVSAGSVAAGPLIGNVQTSAIVMGMDYLMVMAQHYDQPGNFATGDLNNDGLVNFQDLILMAQNWGHPLGIAPQFTAAAKNQVLVAARKGLKPFGRASRANHATAVQMLHSLRRLKPARTRHPAGHKAQRLISMQPHSPARTART